MGYSDLRSACPNPSEMRDFTSKGLAHRSEDNTVNTQAKRRRVQESRKWVARRTKAAKGYAWVPADGDGGEAGGEENGEEDGEDEDESERRTKRVRKPRRRS